MKANNKLRTITLRLIASFFAGALSVAGLSAMAGLDALKSGLVAGIGGVLIAVQALTRAYARDGKLSNADIDEAFSAIECDETKSE